WCRSWRWPSRPCSKAIAGRASPSPAGRWLSSAWSSRSGGGTRRCETGPEPGAVVGMARAPAEHPLRLAVRDPPVLAVEGAGPRAESGLLERPQGGRSETEQAAGLLDHRVLACRQVVGQVVGARRRVEARQHARGDVVHMDAAEHLA